MAHSNFASKCTPPPRSPPPYSFIHTYIYLMPPLPLLLQFLTLPWRSSLSYRNKSIDLLCQSMQINELVTIWCSAQKMSFSIKNFFSKCDQIRKKLWIWSHLLKKSFMENFMFFAVIGTSVMEELNFII